MRAIIKTSPEAGTTSRSDYPEVQTPPPGRVSVKIVAASICGTDLGIVRYTPAAAAFKMNLPVVIGHEAAGIVSAVGDGVDGFSVGDHVAFESHVACFSCSQCGVGNAHICENMQLLGLHLDGVFADSCTVPARALYQVPASIPLEQAALFEPAGVAMHAIQCVDEPLLGKRVLVTGGGPVGLLIAELSLLAGAARVVVIEPNPWRRQFAESRGSVALAPEEFAEAGSRAHSGGGGFDVAFEASGHPSSTPVALQALRDAGTYVSVGFASEPLALDAGEILNRRGIVLRGSYGRRLWTTWNLLAALVEEGRLDLGAFITHRLPLSEFDEALELLSGQACKVLLIPGGD